MLVALEPLPEVVGVQLGDQATLDISADGDGRKFHPSAGQDIAVALAQVFVIGIGQVLGGAFIHDAPVCLSRRFMFTAQR